MSINYRELIKFYLAHGGGPTDRLLRESIDAGHIGLGEFSVRECAYHCVLDRFGEPAGRQFVEDMCPRSGFRLIEAGSAVNTTAFSNITGQIVYSKILDAYQAPELLWPKLCETVPTPFDGERIPGLTEIGDEDEIVGEGKPYPHASFGEDWIDTPRTQKRGKIVDVTRETIFFDRTHRIMSQAGTVGNWLGMNKEKRVIDVVVGTTNNWKWRDSAYNTYGTAGAGEHPYSNTITDALVNWTDISSAEQAFNAMTDFYTGEPILRPARTLVVPLALLPAANYSLFNQGMSRADTTANTVHYREMILPSTVLQNTYNVISGPMVKARSSSDAKWWIGDPLKAFAYYENWAIQTLQATDNTEVSFTRDVVMRFRADERGVAATQDPSWMVYSVGDDS